MSWRDNKKNIEGVRKVKWDELWHVMYRTNLLGETWDRVDKKTAMYVLKMLPKYTGWVK
jgi:hypothetical protein